MASQDSAHVADVSARTAARLLVLQVLGGNFQFLRRDRPQETFLIPLTVAVVKAKSCHLLRNNLSASLILNAGRAAIRVLGKES